MAGTYTDQGAGVEAWEYAIFQGSKDMIATVNDLDVEGWHLVNIIRKYDLSNVDPAVLGGRAPAELVETIISGVRSQPARG